MISLRCLARRRCTACHATLIATLLHGPLLRAQGTPYTATSPLRVCCASAFAQASAARDTAPSVLWASRNAADTRAAIGERWRRVVLEANGARGAWKRPQDAAQRDAVSVTAEGAQAAGRWLTTGVAQYQRATDTNVEWNNGSDAYLGSSYVWADSVGGTFRRDALALSGSIVAPAWHRLTSALQIDYALGQGARRNDPRPLFRRRVAELAPAIALTLGKHTIGLGGMIGWHREDQEIGGGTSTDFPIVFRLRGISTFDRTQLISAERAVIGGVVGAHAAWARSGDRWQASLGSTVRVERDSVRDGISTPVTNGATRRLRVDGTAALRRRSAAGGIEWRAQLRTEDARGRDPVFAAINAIDQGADIESRLRWWRGASPIDARWTAEVSVDRAGLSRRDVAAETQWSATMPGILTSVGHRFGDGEQLLHVALGGGARRPSGLSYVSRRPTRITPVLALADYAVVAVASTHSALSIAWETRHAGVIIRRLRLDATVARTNDLLADNRRSLSRTRWSLSYELF